MSSSPAAAALFGASTPLAKLLVCALPPLPLAGLLYLGSGIGLLGWWRLRRHRGQELREAALTRCDALWLAGGAILAGGVVGPVLLTLGLAHVAAARRPRCCSISKAY